MKICMLFVYCKDPVIYICLFNYEKDKTNTEITIKQIARNKSKMIINNFRFCHGTFHQEYTKKNNKKS